MELADGNLAQLQREFRVALPPPARPLKPCQRPAASYALSDVERWRRLSHRAVAAVAYVHRRGYAHRDLKPENFLYVAQGDRVMLSDFAFAVPVPESGVVAAAGPIGTPGYIAPEVECPHVRIQWRTVYDPRAADMWALGETLLALWTGQLYPHGMKEFSPRCRGGLQMQGCMARDRVLGEALPKELQSLLQGLLKLRPEHRLTAEQSLRHPFFTGLEADVQCGEA